VQAHALSTEISALNDLSAAEVNTEVDTALSDYDAPTKAELDSAFTEIKGATWASGTDTLELIRDKLTDIEVDTQDLQLQIGTDGDGLTSIGDTRLANLDAAITSRSSHSAADVWTSGTRTLTANTNLNDPTAGAIADAVWDEAIADHVGVGSFGEEVQAHAQTGDAMTLTSGERTAIATEVFGTTIENSKDFEAILRKMLAFIAGETSGGGTSTINFRDDADTKNRLTYTVDSSGNRTLSAEDLT